MPPFVVTGPDGSLAGIVTDGDICRHLAYYFLERPPVAVSD